MTTTHRVDVAAAGIRYALWVPRPDHVGDVLSRTGRPYEERLLSLCTRLVRPGDVVADVGANIGNHSMYWALVGRARVHAFEPNPVAADILARNVETTGCGDRVRVHRVALSSAPGRGIVRPRREANLGAVAVEASETGDVAVTRLDDALAGERVRLVKVDVEGAEAEVLAGAEATLAACRPVVVAEAATREERCRIDAVLAPHGYRRVPVSFCSTPTFVWAPSLVTLLRVLLSPESARQLVDRLR